MLRFSCFSVNVKIFSSVSDHYRISYVKGLKYFFMQFHADLVTFTEESNNGKLHFLSSESFADSIMRNSNYCSINVKHLFDDSGRTPCRRRTFWRLLFQADKEGHFFWQERVDNLNDTKINQWEKAFPKITKTSQSNILITSQSNILIMCRGIFVKNLKYVFVC